MVRLWLDLILKVFSNLSDSMILIEKNTSPEHGPHIMNIMLTQGGKIIITLQALSKSDTTYQSEHI